MKISKIVTKKILATIAAATVSLSGVSLYMAFAHNSNNQNSESQNMSNQNSESQNMNNQNLPVENTSPLETNISSGIDFLKIGDTHVELKQILKKPDNGNDVNLLKKDADSLEHEVKGLINGSVKKIEKNTFDKIAELIKNMISKMKVIIGFGESLNDFAMEKSSLNGACDRFVKLAENVNSVYADKTKDEETKFNVITSGIADGLKDFFDSILENCYDICADAVKADLRERMEESFEKSDFNSMSGSLKINDENSYIGKYISVVKTKEENEKEDLISFVLAMKNEKLDSLDNLILEIFNDKNEKVLTSKLVKERYFTNNLFTSVKGVGNLSPSGHYFKNGEVYTLKIVDNNSKEVVTTAALTVNFEKISKTSGDNRQHYDWFIDKLVYDQVHRILNG